MGLDQTLAKQGFLTTTIDSVIQWAQKTRCGRCPSEFPAALSK
jgi:hypothetical protein